MDSFWGPVIMYGIVIGVGFLTAALGAGLTEDKRYKSSGNAIAMLGVAIMGVGTVPLVAKFVGTFIEKLF